MINPEFLDDLRAQFPEFYARVNEEAMRNASRLRAESGGDLQRALVRARFEGAASVWWPYVRGAVPVVGNRRPAMEAFSRLVLTIDHLVGYQPPGMEAARRQVIHVLEETVDADRLMRFAGLAKEEQAAAGAAGAVAGFGALIAPFQMLGRFRKLARFVPAPVRIAIGAAILVTLASIPIMAGMSAATQAERAARNFGEVPRTRVDVSP